MDEIQARGVQHQHVVPAGRVQHLVVGPGQAGQILPGDVPLEFPAPPRDMGQNLLQGRAQVHHQVGPGKALVQGFVHLEVHLQFVALQVQPGEDGVFEQAVIRHHGLPRLQGRLHLLHQLAVTVHQEENLGGKRVARRVFIKAGQEGVFGHGLVQGLGVEQLRQAAGQGRLAHADDPFHHQVKGALKTREVHAGASWGRHSKSNRCQFSPKMARMSASV